MYDKCEFETLNDLESRPPPLAVRRAGLLSPPKLWPAKFDSEYQAPKLATPFMKILFLVPL
jgi:hypothetical protein